MDRPLRVAAQSWPLLAPGLLASSPPAKSSDAFGGAPLGVVFEHADVATLEAMLARGGADERGADLALMTLPDFVRSYDRLRALEPRIVFIAGWSRGGHGLWGERGAVVDGRARKLSAATSSPAAFLGAWLLEAGGANLGELRLVSGDGGPWSAGDAESPTEDLYPCVTAHHANLVPYVIVAPAGSWIRIETRFRPSSRSGSTVSNACPPTCPLRAAVSPGSEVCRTPPRSSETSGAWSSWASQKTPERSA